MRHRRIIDRFFIPALIGAAFVITYGQDPLYTHNQNTHFLHGLARGGLGNLSEDWLANTCDPFPAFGALVDFTYRRLPEWTFPSRLCRTPSRLYPKLSWHRVHRGPMSATISTGILFGNCRHFDFAARAAVRYEVSRLPVIGKAISGVIGDGGMAGLYILGPVFQPSTFGVLLLVSILFFLKNRPYLAVLCARLRQRSMLSTCRWPRFDLRIHFSRFVCGRRLRHGVSLGNLIAVLLCRRPFVR